MLDAAKKELAALPKTQNNQIVKRLIRLQDNPHVPSLALSGNLAGCYEIKLRSSGIRAVYHVSDTEMTILVIAIGKRERKQVFKTASDRFNK
ncbi:type II toxin-antitoxin system mRNA interferase toxin, RelE/StbE family [Novacetimonas sp. GS1]